MSLKVIIIIGLILTILAIGINVYAHFLEKKYKNNAIKNYDKK